MQYSSLIIMRAAIVAIFAVISFPSLASGTIVDKNNVNSQTPWIVYVRNDQVARYALPSLDAAIVEHLYKGSPLKVRTIPVRNNVSVEFSQQWLYDLDEPGYRQSKTPGWIKREDVVTPLEFNKVVSWPMRYLLFQQEQDQQLIFFTVDGKYKVIDYSDTMMHYGKLIEEGQLYIFDDIIVMRERKRMEIERQWLQFGGSVLGILNGDQCVLQLGEGDGFTPQRCQKLLDPEYALIGGNFAQAQFTDPLKPIMFRGKCVADCEK